MLPVIWLFALTINSVNPQTVKSADEVVTISASASGLSDKTQYLQAVFTKEGEASNYSGFTQNQKGDWYQYKSDPELEKLFNFSPISGSWSGELKAKIDTSDSGYKGPGSYILKLFKYITSSGTASNNFMVVKIEVPEIKEPEPTPKEEVKVKTEEIKVEEPKVPEPSKIVEKPKPVIKVATVAAVATAAARTPEILFATPPAEKKIAKQEQQNTSPLVFAGVGFITLAGLWGIISKGLWKKFLKKPGGGF